jgi:phage shock protein PspC (stress-responsive transcriptional regulator)
MSLDYLTKQQTEQLELGRKIQDIYRLGHSGKKEALKMSFLKGIVGGIGTFLGGTVVIGTLIWILSLFGGSRVLGPLVRSIQQILEK